MMLPIKRARVGFRATEAWNFIAVNDSREPAFDHTSVPISEDVKQAVQRTDPVRSMVVN